MTGADFDRPARPGVRNATIVRDVDHARVRQMVRLVLVFLVFGMVAAASVRVQLGVIHHGYSIEELRKQITGQEERRRRLQLDRAALLAPQRLERIARQQLRLAPPLPEAMFVIERVAPSPVPDRGVVAFRK